MISFTISDSVAAQSHFNRMEDKVARLVAEVKRWQEAEKLASEKARKLRTERLRPRR